MVEGLADYQPLNEAEHTHKRLILELLQKGPACYFRDHYDPGHITCSAVLTSYDGQSVLLNHHKSLNKWLCFGGHADGEMDTLGVAAREVREESGIMMIESVMSRIIDVDVHSIPPSLKRQEPAHNHYDLRYIFRVADPKAEQFTISDESFSLLWCNYEEAISRIEAGGSMARLLGKWHKIREEFR